MKAQGIDEVSLGKIMIAFKEKTIESLSVVISKIKVLDSLPEYEKLLSNQNLSDLKGFIDGTLAKGDQRIRNVLKYLPEAPKKINQ